MYKYAKTASLILLVPFIILSQQAFADPAFEQCVIAAGEANGWTEHEQYLRLECKNAGISSVSDLERFPNLGALILEGNNLSSLDTSVSSALFHLNVNGNGLSSLTISGNGNLSVLLAANNQLTSLDTGSNGSLATLSLGGNSISSLDLSGNPNLARLYVHNNNLSTLDISANEGIYEMTAGNNGLTSVNLGPSGSLQTLGLANNNLTTLEIRGHGGITYLNVAGNPLDQETYDYFIALKETAEEKQEAGEDVPDFELLIDEQASSDIEFSDPKFEQCVNAAADANDWESPPEVTSLDCSNGGISNVNELFYFTNIGHLNLSGNNISSINLSANSALFNLNVSGNSLSTLDISSNTGLSVLLAANNGLNSLDTSENGALAVLNLGDNTIGSLDLSHNSNLGRVFVHNNSLTTLDISNNSGITELVAGGNGITSINLGSGSLETLGLANNQLTSLDISGHGALNYLNLEGNPLDAATVSLLTGIAEDQGDGFTLLIDTATESVPPPEETIPEAARINTVGGSRAADIRLGAYSASGTPTYSNDFTAGDFITLYGSVVPDPVDVGVNGEIYAAMLSVVSGKASFSYIDEDGNFAAWDTTLPGLGAYQEAAPLQESHELRVFEGTLQAGVYKITFAYKAEGGPLVFMKPLTIRVSN